MLCCSQTLGWHELHVGPGGGRAKCGCVGGIVLLALLYEGPDRLGRDQLHVVPKTDQHADPVVRRAAGLQDDRASLLLLEERDQLAPS